MRWTTPSTTAKCAESHWHLFGLRCSAEAAELAEATVWIGQLLDSPPRPVPGRHRRSRRGRG